ncbi:MAG TPA: hypothetical protein VJM50_07170, partial [Pyrinomonadaceae bacterium]|nr:hypothetical protein [Pyrinomonadaceae bacterium]
MGKRRDFQHLVCAIVVATLLVSCLFLPAYSSKQPIARSGITSSSLMPEPRGIAEPGSILFQDNFDAENGGEGALNYFGLTHWNVTFGSIDLIGNGFADFLPGNGLYLDLDGTTGAAGTIESKQTFTLVPGTYRLKFSLAGSQRGDANQVEVHLANVFTETFTPPSDAPFETVVRDIVVMTPTTGKLAFGSFGADNMGFLLDNVQLLTDITESHLFNITPNHGGNTGNVTVTLNGINFPGGPVQVRLIADGHEVLASTAAVTSATQIVATFNLAAATPGIRDVELTLSDGSTLTLPSGFTIDEGGAAQLWVDIIGRDLIRANTEQTYTIIYGNRGNVDAPAPLLELSAPDTVKFALFDGKPLQDSPLRIFAGGQHGSAGVLPPGTYSLQVKIKTPIGLNQIDLDLSIVETTGMFDWDRLAVEGVPAGTDQNDWQLRVTAARSRIGNSLNDVMTVLRDGASRSGEDANTFYDFEEFLTYTVGFYGSNPEEFSGNSITGESVISQPERHNPSLLSTSNSVQLITISESPDATETFVLTHGFGGLKGFDDLRKDFFEAAAAIQREHPNANIYIADWTEGAKTQFGILDPFRPALNIDDAGDALFELLHEKQQQGLFNPSTATFIGESFGNSVNSQIARNFKEQGLGKIDRALLLNPANLLGVDLSFRTNFNQSIALSTESLFDYKLKRLAEYTLYLETDTLNQIKQHTSGIPKLRDHPELLGIFENPDLQRSLSSLNSDGRILLGSSVYVPSSFNFLFGSLLSRALLPQLLLLETLRLSVVNSFDPNDKAGSLGAGNERYVSGEEPLRYMISFENVKTATAPARDVVITDQLELSSFDLNTFSFGPISFGDKSVVPSPGLSEFSGNVDLRPQKDLIVNVTALLNKETGLVTWTFTSLDPATGLPVTDPLAGFLPPNVNPPEGDGSVVFTVSSKPNLPTGTVIPNAASIVFDTNPAIPTQTWSNTLDNSAP